MPTQFEFSSNYTKTSFRVPVTPTNFAAILHCGVKDAKGTVTYKGAHKLSFPDSHYYR